MLIADLPRRQRFGEVFAIELRIGAQSRHRSYIDKMVDAGLSKQIDQFDAVLVEWPMVKRCS
jgi:hypothetical protein